MVLFSPFAWPMPICASPVFFITLLTSAKSRLIKLGVTIKSEIPWIPCLRTSSAYKNASIIGVFCGTSLSSLSFGIITKVSTYFLKFSSPLSAFSCLFLPSKPKGFVTTAIVKIPISLAIWATTGAAPVPVPPPIPAVINTRSQSFKISLILALLSSAAFCPTSGSAPAPSPRVSFSPIWSLWSALLRSNACLSVLIAINCALVIFASIILFTALFPPPPTPITFIFATGPTSILLYIFSSPYFFVNLFNIFLKNPTLLFSKLIALSISPRTDE